MIQSVTNSATIIFEYLHHQLTYLF